MEKIGVFIARMQPLHNTHVFLINELLKKHQRVCVVLGSANKKDMIRNPYPLELRLEILKEVLGEYDFNRLTIFELPDWGIENDVQEPKMWGVYLYFNIVSRMKCKYMEFIYSDSIDIINNWFKDTVVEKYVEIDHRNREVLFDGLSATKIREAIFQKDLEYLIKYTPQPVYNRLEMLSTIWKNVLDKPKDDFRL